MAFRSEEHVNRWCEQRELERGAAITLDQCWRLAKVWYPDRLKPEWRRFTPDEMEAIFDSIGAHGEFWRARS